jgi:hypothetical protein
MSAELIARLEGAKSGSQELDAQVAAFIIGGTVIQSPRNGMWCVYLGANHRGEPSLWEPRDIFGALLRQHLYSEAGGPTRSLNAAVMMVPEGWSWRVGNLPSGRGFADLGTQRSLQGIEGATPALALCIAALKARASV